MSKQRVAMIGCGGIARSHATGYERLSDRVEVAYLVDPNLENAERLAERLGGRAVADYDGILGEVDAVDVCTPHHLHYAQARDALAAGCGVLVEKPLANLRSECEELVQLAADTSRTLMVGYVLRYMPAVARLKEVIEAGTYGDIIQVATSVEVQVTGDRLPWAAKRDQLGGGVLFSHGCHTVDLMVWLAGPVKRVAMVGNNVGAEWMEGEGTDQVIVEFESGALGHHNSSWAMAHRHPIPFLRVWCRDGFLEVAGRSLNAYVGGECKTLHEPDEDELPSMSIQIEHFVECLETGAEPLTSGRVALPSLAVIWGAHESRDTGRFAEF